MKFELTGYNIDTLLQTLYNKKILLRNINRIAYNKVVFDVDDKFEKKVKRYIANYKVEKTKSFFKRIPAMLLVNLGVIIGVFVGSIFYLFASNYIWQIRVYGIKDLSQEDILQVLNDNGIRKGKLNLKTSEDIENILLNNYDRIAQVSVIKQGTAIIINLSEKLVYIEEEHKPITAKYCGIIKEINVITGTKNVKIGDYVNIGDILVLPFNLDAANNKISVEPLAEIKAEIFVIGKCELPRKEQVLVRTGKICKEYKYKLLKFNLFSGKTKNSFDLFEVDVYNECISNLIPLSRDVYTYYEMDYSEIEHNFEEDKLSLIEQSKSEAHRFLPVGKILNESSTTTIVGNTMFAITTISVYGIIND